MYLKERTIGVGREKKRENKVAEQQQRKKKSNVTVGSTGF